MKPSMEILYSAIVILLTTACSGCSSEAKDNCCDSTLVGVAEVGEMLRSGQPADVYMPAQEKLVEQMRRGRAKDSPVDILSQSGYFYLRQGEYLKALDYLHEASDSMSSVKDNATLRGLISLPGNLSSLYFQFGLFEDALKENTKAIEISRNNDNMAMSDLLRMRGAIFDGMYKNDVGNPNEIADSTLYYYRGAIDKAKTKASRDMAEVIWAEFFIDHPEFAPDSIPAVVSILKRVAGQDGEDTPTARAILGKALVYQGDVREGLDYMKTALEEFHKLQDVKSEEWTIEMLADAYLRTDRFDLLKGIYHRYKALQDSMAKEEKINAAIGMEYRYRVREKDRELSILEEKHNLINQKLTYQRLVLLLAIIVIIGIIAFALHQLRLVEREKKSAQNKIDSILYHQKTLNLQIESLNQQISSLQSEKTIETLSKELTPSLLRGEEERDFRKAFATLYPNFLRNMRRDFPDLTDNDELVCMLIFLRFNSDEIALSLGISRLSVNSIRHRIRKKMRLEKGDDLDQSIFSRDKSL